MKLGDLLRQSSNKRIAMFIAALMFHKFEKIDTSDILYKERVKVYEELLETEVEVEE